MHVFSLQREQEWNPEKHVEKILVKVGGGDVTVACWEPGQISPYHCHPDATEIYFRFSGGGKMRPPRSATLRPRGRGRSWSIQEPPARENIEPGQWEPWQPPLPFRQCVTSPVSPPPASRLRAPALRRD
jgi:hypothetical protein